MRSLKQRIKETSVEVVNAHGSTCIEIDRDDDMESAKAEIATMVAKWPSLVHHDSACHPISDVRRAKEKGLVAMDQLASMVSATLVSLDAPSSAASTTVTITTDAS